MSVYVIALDIAGFTATFVDVGLNFRNIIEPDPYARIKLHYKWQLSLNGTVGCIRICIGKAIKVWG